MQNGQGPFDPGAPLTNGHPETHEERDLRLRAEAFRQRMKEALDSADDAFWAVIAKSFPEVETGDFPPDAVRAWDDAMGKSLYTWLQWNAPGSEALLNRIMKGS